MFHCVPQVPVTACVFQLFSDRWQTPCLVLDSPVAAYVSRPAHTWSMPRVSTCCGSEGERSVFLKTNRICGHFRERRINRVREQHGVDADRSWDLSSREPIAPNPTIPGPTKVSSDSGVIQIVQFAVHQVACTDDVEEFITQA